MTREHSLVIKYVTLSDAGRYSCSAEKHKDRGEYSIVHDYTDVVVLGMDTNNDMLF